MTAGDAQHLAQARQALLKQRLRGQAYTGIDAVHAVTQRRDTGPAPLSICQRQLWYLSQLAPESTAYNELVTIRKTGSLNTDALRRAFTEVVRRHEMWRTTFPIIDGEPRQVVHDPPSFELPMLDFSEMPLAQAERAAGKLAAEDTQNIYDLAAGPLLRPRLVRLAVDQHRLYLGLHHLVFDGVSLYRIVLPELVTLYEAYAAGLSSPLAEPPIQYGDYAAWELEAAHQPDVAAKVERWRHRLARVAPLELPLDHPRPPQQRFRGGMVPLSVAPSTVARLRAIGQREGATLFQVLAAAYAWWLHQYSGQDDVVFATPNDLRRRPELTSMVGYCLTPVVLRGDVSGEPTFAELIARMRGEVVDGLDDAVPFEQLVRELGLPRDPRTNPVFQASLVLEPPTLPADPAWSMHQMETTTGEVGAKLDLGVELDERPEGHISGRIFYDSDLFERGTAEQMVQHWIRLLDVLADDPDGPLAALNLVDEQERHRQLVEWNPSVAPVATEGRTNSERCVYDVILMRAALTPDAVAVVAGEDQLTYRQLAERATAVAQRLIAAGAGPGTIVATILDRTPDLVVGVLGVLISGAAYLPLDPKQPARRNAFMIADADAPLLLTRAALVHEIPSVNAVVVAMDGPATDSRRVVAPRRRPIPEDLAYVIYTSGSTGRPKGVQVEHRGVTNLMGTLLPRLGITASDTVLSVAPYTFDLSVGDIFGALGLGARLVLASSEQATDPRALAALIESSGATLLCATPTTWSALLSASWSGAPRLTAASGGEPLVESLAARLSGCCRAVWNGYGPTETTVLATYGRMVNGEPVTVGRPLPGTRVYVLDEKGRPLPTGVPGEVVIGGSGVARGYLNRPTETAARFGADPFVEGGRVYRSGDRGRLMADGRLQHLGRYDEQVKVRGFRIEPGEIEAVLAEHPAVSASVVVAREDLDGERQLVAYVVGRPTTDVALRSWLRSRLPDHMVPGGIVHLPALPVTSSGKVDRAALPAPESRLLAAHVGQAPRTATERRLADLWSAVLRREVADVHADFFDLGGHSLLAVRLMAETEAQFGDAIALADFIRDGTTIAGLAMLLEQPPTIAPAVTTRTLFFVYPDPPSAVSLRHFVHAWGSEQEIHPLVPAQPNGRFDPAATVETLVRPLLEAIREMQPHGPYALVGFSLGGLLAYEIARQLSATGEQVDWLGVLDTPTPATADLLLRQITPWGRFVRLRTRSRKERWAKYREVGLRTLRAGPNAPRPDEHFDYRGAVLIARAYTTVAHELPTELFVTADSAVEVNDASLGWDKYHRGPLRIHRLPGHHNGLLDQPQVTELARLLLANIRHDSTASEPAVAAERQEQPAGDQ